MADRLTEPSGLRIPNKAWMTQTLVRLAELERAQRVLDELDPEDWERGEMLISCATLRLAQGDAEAAITVIAPALSGAAPLIWPPWAAHGHMIKALALDALGDAEASESSVENALEAAESEGAIGLFLLSPAPGLIERHARHRSTHASLIADIRALLSGGPATSGVVGLEPMHDALSISETRVLRYLPTNLSAPEIAQELYVSPNTVKTHMRNIYAKLGTHRRNETVDRARALGLLAPSSLRH